MIEHNENKRSKTFFTKTKISKKNPSAWEMVLHNRNKRSKTLFKKDEIEAKNPSA